MFGYVIRRLLWMIPSFFAISLVSFIIIHLPPGDFVTSYAADLATSGAPADETTLDNLRIRYGLKDPLPLQYLRWIGNRSEEHTSELQSHHDLVCSLLLEKKKKTINDINKTTTHNDTT